MIDDIYSLNANDIALGHQRQFCRDTLRGLLHEHGYQVLHEEGIYLKPLPLGVLKTLPDLEANLQRHAEGRYRFSGPVCRPVDGGAASMKTAVVVGATSMLGRQLIARLEADGVAVLTAGRAGQAAIGLDLESGWLGADRMPRCAPTSSFIARRASSVTVAKVFARIFW
ncbi:hypothetical protein ACU4GD_01675 [Cupriavidus basilensis]